MREAAERIRAECAAEAAEHVARVREAGRMTINPLPIQINGGSVAPRSKPARKSDVIYRQSKDRDARELEVPVDAESKAERLARLREIARTIAAVPAKAETRNPRVRLGVPVERKPLGLPPLSAEARRAALEGATAFLAGRGTLVTVCDRTAAIRHYRVTGRRDPMLAADVVRFAQELGFDRV